MNTGTVRILQQRGSGVDELADFVTSLGFEVQGSFKSGEEFLKSVDDNFDVAIIEINLEGTVSGIDVAAELHHRKKPFIFVTNCKNQELIERALKTKPNAFLSRPYKQIDLAATLSLVSQDFEQEISIKQKDRTISIAPSKILFVKADNVYIEIFTKRGSFTERKLLKEIEHELPEYFLRTHRSYLVNSRLVKRKNSNTLSCGPYVVPISRSYKSKVSSLK